MQDESPTRYEYDMRANLSKNTEDSKQTDDYGKPLLEDNVLILGHIDPSRLLFK